MKDLKIENVSLTATPQVAELLASFGIQVNPQGAYELAKLTKEQYLQFRHLFIEERMNSSVFLRNKNNQAMELLLSAFAMIICKKLPAEVPHPQTLHTKVRMVPEKVSAK